MTKQRLKTMKQMRSMTAATTIHSLIICCFLSVSWRSRASLRSFVFSWWSIEANRRSAELTLCSSAAATATVDEDGVRSLVSIRSRMLYSTFDVDLKRSMTPAAVSGAVFWLRTRNSSARRPQIRVRTLTQRHSVASIMPVNIIGPTVVLQLKYIGPRPIALVLKVISTPIQLALNIFLKYSDIKFKSIEVIQAGNAISWGSNDREATIVSDIG